MKIKIGDNSLNLKVGNALENIDRGPRGYSAYEVAVQEGFVGTEEEWLASLVGPEGPRGKDGERGLEGPRGKEGPAGAQGKDGASGIAVFSIDANGHLIATSESAENLTNYSLGDDGHLYLTIEEV